MSPLKRLVRVNVADVNIEFKCSECDKGFRTEYLFNTHMSVHNTGLPFSCDLCQYRCKVKKYLSRHKKKVHTKANGPACNVCGKVFHYSSLLKKHMRVHTGERPFHCEVCNKSFNSTYCLSMHKLIHTNEKPYECKFCDYACRDNSTLRRHEDRHLGTTRMYPCNKCKKTFHTNARLRMHVNEVHYGLNLKQIPCEHCNKMFKTKSQKNAHIKTVHERVDRSLCEICDRVISRNNMSSHLTSHIDIRPYTCSFKNCHKQFKDRCTLKKHTLIHYPELYYQCDLCDSRFVRKTRLRDHKKWHVANGFVCDYCGGSFKTKSYLQTHITRKHMKPGERYICDVCQSVHYTKQSIILHLRYGHGCRDERSCRICGVVLQNNAILTEHYLIIHKVRYIVIKKEEVTIKKEPEELSQNFIFDYEVQKIEVDDGMEPSDNLTDCNKKVETNITSNIQSSHLDDFKDYKPEYVDTETTLAYSEKVLEEDFSRSIHKNKRSNPDSPFEEFFNDIVDKSQRRKLSEGMVDQNKLMDIQKTIDKMLQQSRMQKNMATLEEMRLEYNKRILLANKSKEKKAATKIQYFKKSSSDGDKINTNANSSDENINMRLNDDKSNNDELLTESTGELVTESTNELVTKSTNELVTESGNELVTTPTNEELVLETSNEELVTRPKRINKPVKRYIESTDSEINKNGKITFDGHECYVCLKVFKTKDDLKFHCKEHFDICNEKMLKKCPFCGYVTNLNIKRHVEIVHKININYDYAHIAENTNSRGSKYVYRIDNDCELEIIPSISNLNKIAGMKVDENRRKANDLFIGKTKLVKKGDGWVVEKQAVGINSDNILPEFTEEDYKKLKLTGVSYFDRLQQLGFLAKKRGAKMLYPCEFCEKICRTLSALKLHNRKHEDNPKQYKPKVWVNRHIEYTTKNRKKRNIPKETKRSIPVINNKKKINYSIENRYAAPQPVKNNHKCDKKLIDFYRNNIRGKDIEFWQFLKIFNKINRENVNDFDDLMNRDDMHFGIHTKDEYNGLNSKCNNNTNKNISTNNPSANNTKKIKLNESVSKRNKPEKKVDKPIINRDKPETIPNSSQNQNKQRNDDFSDLSNKPTITEKPFTIKKLVTPNKMYKINKIDNKKRNRVILISKKENLRRNAIKNEMRKRLANNNI